MTTATAAKQAPNLRLLRSLTEREATLEISRIGSQLDDLFAISQAILETMLLVPGIVKVTLHSGEPLRPVLDALLTLEKEPGAGVPGSAVASIEAAGKTWGELRIEFQLDRLTSSDAPLRFTRFAAQQLAIAAELADVRGARNRLRETQQIVANVIAKRKSIHRAKALLVNAHQIAEDQAFLLLRNHSRATGRSLQQIAEGIILADRNRRVPPVPSVRPLAKRRVG